MIDRLGRVLHVVPPLPPAAPEDQAAELDERVKAVVERMDSLEARVGTLEQQADGTPKKDQ